jgi:hypothetical protein
MKYLGAFFLKITVGRWKMGVGRWKMRVGRFGNSP